MKKCFDFFSYKSYKKEAFFFNNPVVFGNKYTILQYVISHSGNTNLPFDKLMFKYIQFHIEKF